MAPLPDSTLGAEVVACAVVVVAMPITLAHRTDMHREPADPGTRTTWHQDQATATMVP
jgi:hypothetical protein